MFDFAPETPLAMPPGVKLSAAMLGLLGTAQVAVGAWLLLEGSRPTDGGMGFSGVVTDIAFLAAIISVGLGGGVLYTAWGLTQRNDGARLFALAIGCAMLVLGILGTLPVAVEVRAASPIAWQLVGLVASHLAVGSALILSLTLKKTKAWFFPMLDSEREATIFLETLESNASPALKKDRA